MFTPLAQGQTFSVTATPVASDTVIVELDQDRDGTVDVAYEVMSDAEGFWRLDTSTAIPVNVLQSTQRKLRGKVFLGESLLQAELADLRADYVSEVLHGVPNGELDDETILWSFGSLWGTASKLEA